MQSELWRARLLCGASGNNRLWRQSLSSSLSLYAMLLYSTFVVKTAITHHRAGFHAQQPCLSIGPIPKIRPVTDPLRSPVREHCTLPSEQST
jgi:hypothetical protein